MKQGLILLLLISMGIHAVFAQEIVKTVYYKDRYTKASNEKKAKYVEYTIKEADGTLTRQTRKIATNNIIESYGQDNAQNGVWILEKGDTLNFDFTVEYGNKEYPGVIKFELDKKQLLSEVNGSFEPPIMKIYNNEIFKLLNENIRYPEVAQENGDQGKIISQFIIDENGQMLDLRIIQNATKVLDKEAARVLLLTKGNWIPAKLDGTPVKVLVTIRINFKIW